MKRFISILSVCLCLCCLAQAKDRVVERPPFLAWSSNSLEVDKIVMNDTLTTVYIKAFYRPKYWIQIATGSFLRDNNGAIYPIRKGVGITLDEKFWMPESGEAEFQLLFPPVPAGVTSLDFSEGDFEGSFKIWGIQLEKNAFEKNRLPQVAKTDKKAALPAPVIAYGKATLKGRIMDYREGMADQLTLYTGTPILGSESGEITVKVDKDGTFQTELGVASTTSVLLFSSLGSMSCLIAPGETTSLLINPRELCRRQSKLLRKEKPYGEPVYYDGYLAALQQELASVRMDLSLRPGHYTDIYREIVGKTPDEYKAYMLERLPDIRKAIAQSKYSTACKELLNIRLDFAAVEKLFMTTRELKSAYIVVNKLEDAEANNYFSNTRIDLPEGYYDTLKEFASINTPQAIFDDSYTLLMYNPDIPEVLKKTLGTDKGTVFDNIRFYKLYRAIKDFNPLTDAQKAELASFSSPAYGEFLTQANQNVLRKIEQNKRKGGYTINEAGQVSNEELLPSILAKFRGHTLLVDFWATWCGPCRMANKTMAPMKEELKKEDILYIYITGETSPKGTWENMIPDIHGEHYRLTDEQWKYLRSEFKIQGVPTYFVVDREGNISYRQTGFPGTETMKKELLKALKK